MDILDSQMQLKPAEFKYQNFVSKWNSVKCVADIDLKFSIPVTSEKSRFESMIFVSIEAKSYDDYYNFLICCCLHCCNGGVPISACYNGLWC